MQLLGGEVAVCYFILAWRVLAAFLVQPIVRSRFGMALQGIKSNEARAASIGLNACRYKLAAFVISGCICAVSGAAGQSVAVREPLLHALEPVRRTPAVHPKLLLSGSAFPLFWRGTCQSERCCGQGEGLHADRGLIQALDAHQN